MFQNYALFPHMTVLQNIQAGAAGERDAARRRQTAFELLERFGLEDLARRCPAQLSGGQRQRCACARAIVVNPDLILADEPTGALDSHAARQLLDIFSMLCRDYHATILMVTHDVMAASCCDQILFMRDGRIQASLNRACQNKQTFFTEILKK